MEIAESLKLLGLSKKEQKVLTALQAGSDTPVKLSKVTDVSRTAIYAILQNLKKRGLVASHTTKGKKRFALASEREVEETLYAAKRTLLNIPEGREEVRGLSDAMVVVHRGKDSIKKLMNHLFFEHKHERFLGFQGGVSTIGWDTMFTVEETNAINRAIKKNGMIVESIVSEGWFEQQTQLLGTAWAKDYEGRATKVNELDPSYFAHGGQLWIFNDAMYLFALKEEIVIEIKNSEMQRMMLAIFHFMQENSRTTDANDLLRSIIAEQEGGED
jgi:DNA-binding MarR family transcriptional regulator